MKIKTKSALRRIFGKECSLSQEAKVLFVFLAGIKSVSGQLPPYEEIPNSVFRIRIREMFDVLIELSDEGYILGNPEKFSLNLKKLKMQSEEFSTKIEAEPKVLDVIRAFQHQHKRYRKSRGIDNGERTFIQIRCLIRNYNGYETVKQIIPFFTDEKTVKAKGDRSIDDFFKYAIRRLEKQFGEPQHVPDELGANRKGKKQRM